MNTIPPSVFEYYRLVKQPVSFPHLYDVILEGGWNEIYSLYTEYPPTNEYVMYIQGCVNGYCYLLAEKLPARVI